MRMKDALFFRFRLLPIIVLVLLIPAISHAQATIKVNDNISLRFGTLIQAWADSAQDATTKGYVENLFMRRMRILIGGTLSPTVSFFFETDNPNLGKAPKNLGGGFITQDAFVEWKPRSSAFILDAGLMLPPLCRNCLESAATRLSLDYGSWSFVESAATQSSVGRDTGFQAKGYLAGGHFEYRAALFQGFRQAGATGRTLSGNALRTTARAMYNVWDTETGYVYPGFYLGNKRILSVGGGFDHQQNYKAYSADGFLSLPVAKKNAFNGEISLFKFDGGTTFAAIPEQRDGTVQLGYYLGGLKVMPWIRYENQDFRTAASNSRDNKRYQLGATWLPNGHNFNIKGAFTRVDPRVGNKTNQYTIQMQFFYY